MLFNFDLFSTVASRAYQEADDPVYSLEEALSVFRYYFDAYERHGPGSPHPPIRSKQIISIIERMHCVDMPLATRDIEPMDYETLIDQHFRTKYRNCDYNINHFFSGDIRMFRLYETLY